MSSCQVPRKNKRNPPVVASRGGFLLRERQRLLSFGRSPLLARTWVQVDELNEYMMMYSSNPEEDHRSALLATVPLDGAQISLLERRSKKKSGQVHHVLEVITRKGRRLAFRPDDARNTGEDQLSDMQEWHRVLLVARASARNAEEILDEWRADPECAVCVGDATTDQEEDDLLSLDSDELTLSSSSSMSSLSFSSSSSSPAAAALPQNAAAATPSASPPPSTSVTPGESSELSLSSDSGSMELVDPMSHSSGLQRRLSLRPDDDTLLAQAVGPLYRVQVMRLNGSSCRLGDVIAASDAPSPTVLLVLRHFGCVLCRALVAWWSQAAEVVERLGARVVAIGIGSPAMARAFAKEVDFQGTLLLDRNRSVYKILKCKRGLQYAFDRRGLVIARNVMRAGFSQGATSGDVLQVGGQFIVSKTQGIVYEMLERYAGDALTKVKPVLRALQLHAYYEPEDSFPGNLPMPTWQSMISRSPLEDEHCVSLLDAQSLREHGYSLEVGVVNPADTASSTLLPSASLPDTLREVVLNPKHASRSAAESSRRSARPLSGHRLLRARLSQAPGGVVRVLSTLSARSDRIDPERKSRSKIGDWRADPSQVIRACRHSFPVSATVLRDGDILYLQRHFLLDGAHENGRSTVRAWVVAGETTQTDGRARKDPDPLVLVARRSTSTGDVKALLFSAAGVLRLFVPSHRLASAGASSGSVLLEQLSRVAEHPELAHLLTAVPRTRLPALMHALHEHENAMLGRREYKFGILYRDDQHLTESKMYKCERHSERFELFLKQIGLVLDASQLTERLGYTGGLDSSAKKRTGDRVVYSRMSGNKIVFHVSTLLPLDVEGIVSRKRHIGNDVCVIVFDDSSADALPFDPTTVRSQFNHIFAVVKPVDTVDDDDCKYRVNVSCKPGVPPFPPALLPTPVYGAQEIGPVLLSKLINGEKAALQSAGTFREMRSRARRTTLTDVTHAVEC